MRRELSTLFLPMGLGLVGKGGRQIVGGEQGLPRGRTPSRGHFPGAERED